MACGTTRMPNKAGAGFTRHAPHLAVLLLLLLTQQREAAAPAGDWRDDNLGGAPVRWHPSTQSSAQRAGGLQRGRLRQEATVASRQGAQGNCSTYRRVHTGCASLVPMDNSTACGNVTLVLNSSTGGQRFAYDSGGREIGDQSLAGPRRSALRRCTSDCADELRCRGLVLISDGNGGFRCITVNDTSARVGTSLRCDSYQFDRNASCNMTCSAGDGLRFLTADADAWRPVASATHGGTTQCERLCDRSPGCTGFVLDSAGGKCHTVNATAAVQQTPFPVWSYARQGFAAHSPAGGGPAVAAWVVPPTAHVFPDDTPASFCTPDATVPSTSIDWAGAPGTTLAAQIGLRVPSSAAAVRLQLTSSPFTHADGPQQGKARPDISRGVSFRQVGLVYAREGGEYRSERGTSWYPDILAPILPGSCTNRRCRAWSPVGRTGNGTTGQLGLRLAYDTGGRQVGPSVATSWAGGVAECQALCDNVSVCAGFTLVARRGGAASCHLVNATNVLVSTSLQTVSFRASETGLVVRASTSRAAWAELKVPPGTEAGVYTGFINVSEVTPQAIPGQARVLATILVNLTVWPISHSCVQSSLASFGKAWGFDSAVVGEIYRDAPATRNPADAFVDMMCAHHTPPEALASSYAVSRPLSAIMSLLNQSTCAQPLFNAAFLGIDNETPPSDINATFIRNALDAIAPRINALQAAGLLRRAYVYGFDESRIEYRDALIRWASLAAVPLSAGMPMRWHRGVLCDSCLFGVLRDSCLLWRLA